MRRTASLPLLLILLLLGAFAPAANAGPKDLVPMTGLDQPDSEVTSMAVRDGRLYIAGGFSVVGPLTGPAAMVSTDGGGRPLPFPMLGRAQNFAEAVVEDGSGGWIVGGVMGYADGVERHALVHVRADGTIDQGFPQTDAGGRVDALLRHGNTLYIGGNFEQVGGKARHNVARIDLTTNTVADGWAPAISGFVQDFALYDGALYVAADTVTKLDAATGAVDGAFAQPAIANGFAFTLAVNASGLYVGGSYGSIAGATRYGLVRLNRTTGALDADWLPPLGAWARAYTLEFAADGKLYVGGSFEPGGPSPTANLLRLTTGATATVDPAFTPAVSGGHVRAIELDDAGRMYVVGNFWQVDGIEKHGVARVAAGNGDLDSSFDVVVDSASGNAGVIGVAAAGERVVFAGGFDIAGGARRNGAAAIDLATGRVTSWNPRPDGWIEQIAAAPDGLIVSGEFTKLGDVARSRLAKVDYTTAEPIGAWAPAPNDRVGEMVAGHGSLFVAGDFTEIGGQPRAGLAKLDLAGTGAADAAWNPEPLDSNGWIATMALGDDGLFVGGDFTQIGGAARSNIAKLALDGAGNAIAAFNPGANDTVTALAVSGDTLLVGGSFSGPGAIGGVARQRAAKLSATTAVVDPAFAPALESRPDAAALDGAWAYLGRGGYALSDGSLNASLVDGEWDSVDNLVVADQSVYAAGYFGSMPGAREQLVRALRIKAPTNVEPPKITQGDAFATLVCSDGAWTAEPRTFERQWLRNGAPIPGATAATLKLGDADYDRAITCRVTARNGGGSATVTSMPVTLTIDPPVTPDVDKPQPPVTDAPAAPAATAAVKCARPKGKRIRCTVTVTGGTAKRVTLKRGRRTVASAPVRARGVAKLRAKRPFKPGRYAVVVTLKGGGSVKAGAPVRIR